MKIKTPLLVASLFLLTCASAPAAPWSLTVVDENNAPLQADVTIDTTYGEPLLHLKTDAAGNVGGDIEPRTGNYLGQAFIAMPGYAPAGGNLYNGRARVTLGAPQTVTGLVEDEDGKPLQGVGVALESAWWGDALDPVGTSIHLYLNEEEKQLFSARTDADGRYTLHDVPADCEVTVAVHDALWRSRSRVFQEAAGEVPRAIVTSPAARVSGRLLKADGTPLADTEISAVGLAEGAYAHGRTDADGRYLLGGMPSGKVAIDIDKGETTDGVLPRLEAELTEGTETRLPDSALTPGATIEIATVPPVAGLFVGLNEQGLLRDIAGRKVRTSARTLPVQVRPGKYQVTLYGAWQGYYASPDFRKAGVVVEVQAGQTAHVTIPLIPALSLTGIARDEQGAPVEGAVIKYGYWSSFTTGPGGRYALSNLVPGQIGFGAGQMWDVLSPRSIALPAAGPVDLVLRKVVRSPLGGRVVDDKGGPIAGAYVKAVWHEPLGASEDGTGTIHSAWTRSGKDGTFTLAQVRAVPDVKLTAARVDCRLVDGGVVAVNTTIIGLDGTQQPNPAPVFVATDIVLQPLPRTATGRVLGDGGKPVAGALVAALCDSTELSAPFGYDSGPKIVPTSIARTDAAGRFKLTRLPEGELDFAAGSGGGYAQLRSVGTELGDIVLQPQAVPKRDLALGRKIVQSLADGDDPVWGYGSLPLLLAPYDVGAALDAARELKPTKDAGDDTTFRVVDLWIRRNPAAAPAELPALLKRLPKPPAFGAPGNAGYMKLLLDVALLLPHPQQKMEPTETANLASLRVWVRGAFATARAVAATVNVAGTTDWGLADQFADLAVLTKTLGEDGAENWTLAAAQIAGGANIVGVPEYSALSIHEVFGELARGGNEFAVQALLLAPDSERGTAVASVAEVLARTDVDAALALLARKDAPAQEPRDVPQVEGDEYFGQAAIAILKRMKQGDAQAALSLARRVKFSSYGSQAIALALAARLQPPDSARALLREAFDLGDDEPQALSRPEVMELARRTDPALAAELAARAEHNFFDPNFFANQYRYMAPATPEQSFVSLQPGRARVWLEWEWRQRPDANAMSQIARKMSALDTARAVEMAAEVSPVVDKDGNVDMTPRYQAQSAIAAYLMAPDSMRSGYGTLVDEVDYSAAGSDDQQ